MPSWLDGKTIAVLTTMLTIALTLGMMQTAHSRLGDDIRNVRVELSDDIQHVRVELGNDINRLDDRVNKVDDRLRSVEVGEVGIATIQTAMVGFDSRLRDVEQHAHDVAVAGGSGG